MKIILGVDYTGYTEAIDTCNLKNHCNAVEGSAYTCIATWWQTGRRRGCVDFCVIPTN